MKAAVYEEFKGPLSIQQTPDPLLVPHGVVIQVKANGICRSDWHGWQGSDPDISLPHIPGHELSGVVESVGKDVLRWRPGDRVTVPFVSGCGRCGECLSGNQQICDYQFQPGFTHWGAFAEYVAIHYADVNLVRLPDELDFVTSASLGCRFSTAYRSIVAQGDVSAGQWVAIHGCGGLGLSAVMIANAIGANVIALDIDGPTLELAKKLGALHTINASQEPNVVEAVREHAQGGAHVSIDALGSTTTCVNSIACLRKRGKHIQVGLMVESHSTPPVPMGMVLSNELELRGSHGMQAYEFPEMLNMITSGKMDPKQLIEKTVTLEEAINELPAMGQFKNRGVTVIDQF